MILVDMQLHRHDTELRKQGRMEYGKEIPYSVFLLKTFYYSFLVVSCP